MKYFIRILLAIVGILFILSLFDNKLTTTETKNEPQTIINDSRTYNQSWRMPRGSEYAEIGKLIIQNNVKICGEYHVKEVTSGEYVIVQIPVKVDR